MWPVLPGLILLLLLLLLWSLLCGHSTSTTMSIIISIFILISTSIISMLLLLPCSPQELVVGLCWWLSEDPTLLLVSPHPLMSLSPHGLSGALCGPCSAVCQRVLSFSVTSASRHPTNPPHRDVPMALQTVPVSPWEEDGGHQAGAEGWSPPRAEPSMAPRSQHQGLSVPTMPGH